MKIQKISKASSYIALAKFMASCEGVMPDQRKMASGQVHATVYSHRGAALAFVRLGDVLTSLEGDFHEVDSMACQAVRRARKSEAAAFLAAQQAA